MIKSIFNRVGNLFRKKIVDTDKDCFLHSKPFSNIYEPLTTGFVSREYLYSPFDNVEKNIKEILEKLKPTSETNQRVQNLIALKALISHKTFTDLSVVYTKGKALSKFFFSKQSKDMLVSLKLIEQLQHEEITYYICTEFGKEFFNVNVINDNDNIQRLYKHV